MPVENETTDPLLSVPPTHADADQKRLAGIVSGTVMDAADYITAPPAHADTPLSMEADATKPRKGILEAEVVADIHEAAEAFAPPETPGVEPWEPEEADGYDRVVVYP